MFRYKFGEEAPKGYIVIKDNEWEFIENQYAYQYRTIQFDESSDVYSSVENLTSALNKVQEENQDILSGVVLGKIRLVFIMPKETFPEFKDTLRTLMTNQKQMTYLIKDIGLIEEIEADNQEDESMKEIKSYLLEPKLDISTKINLFMKEFIQSDNVLDKETIMHYITDPLEL